MAPFPPPALPPPKRERPPRGAAFEIPATRRSAAVVFVLVLVVMGAAGEVEEAVGIGEIARLLLVVLVLVVVALVLLAVLIGLLALGVWVAIALIVVALVICAGVTLWLWRSPHGRWAQLSGGLLVGGALANVADRLIYGHVLDFLNNSCCGLNNPFVYNLADVFIFAGALGLILFTGEPKSAPKRRGKKGQ